MSTTVAFWILTSMKSSPNFLSPKSKSLSYLHANSFSRICTLDISCFVFYTLLRHFNKIYTVMQNNKHSIFIIHSFSKIPYNILSREYKKEHWNRQSWPICIANPLVILLCEYGIPPYSGGCDLGMKKGTSVYKPLSHALWS